MEKLETKSIFKLNKTNIFVGMMNILYHLKANIILEASNRICSYPIFNSQ